MKCNKSCNLPPTPPSTLGMSKHFRVVVFRNSIPGPSFTISNALGIGILSQRTTCTLCQWIFANYGYLARLSFHSSGGFLSSTPEVFTIYTKDNRIPIPSSCLVPPFGVVSRAYDEEVPTNGRVCTNPMAPRTSTLPSTTIPQTSSTPQPLRQPATVDWSGVV